MKRLAWLPVALAMGALLIVAGCASIVSAGVQKGDTAQDFSLPTVDGGAENLRDYRGRVVILNFWTTWCGPCRAEMPDLQAVYSELRERGMVVVAVNQGESSEKVQAFAREFGLTFPILLDEDKKIGSKYGVRAYPTTFIIDEDGVISQVVVGGLTRSQLKHLLGGILK